MTTFRLIRADQARAAHPAAEDLADAALLGREQGAKRLWRRGLLRALAAEVLAVHPDGVNFERSASGQVRIVRPEARCVSLSERGGWIALAIAEHPVGVDVETHPSNLEPPLDLLHPLEQAEIRAGADRARSFLRFWTAREAWLKAQGRGLDVELAAIRATAVGDAVVLAEEGRSSNHARIFEREDAIAAIVELALDA